MVNNLEIFVSYYKEKKHDIYLDNKVYKEISVGNNDLLLEYKDNDGENISSMNNFYSELTGFYWVWKNHKILDYIGFCSYRRYFNFFNDIPSIDGYDIILPYPIQLNCSIYEQYSIFHNKDDIEEIINILIRRGISEEIIKDVFLGNRLYTFNMFVMGKELFCEYCDFVFSVLDEYCNNMGIEDCYDVEKMVGDKSEKYLKEFYPNNSIKYQSRIGGFLAERLLTFWVNWRCLKIKHVGVIETEGKYKEIDEKDFL